MIRNSLKILGVLLSFAAAQAMADNWRSGVQMAEDLQPVSVDSYNRKLPVLVFFAAKDCQYCEMLEEDHLSGMARSSEYKDKVIIRKVLIDDYDDIRDFQGNKISSDNFSDKFSIKVTPTLLLVDHEGKPLSKKILGYNRSDFFGLYIDEAIDEAKKRIN